jgi:hypothetical protein
LQDELEREEFFRLKKVQVNIFIYYFMYFSKHDHVGLKIQVGATMRVLSWESHNSYFQHYQQEDTSPQKDFNWLNPSELLGIAHGSIYSIL